MNSKHNNVISEQTIVEKFGEPLTTEELTKNWSEYKVPEKKAPKKKGGPKPSYWGTKHSKKVKKPDCE